MNAWWPAVALACLLVVPPARASGDTDAGAATSHLGSLSWRLEQPNRGLDPWHALRVEVSSTPGNWQRAWQVAAVSERRFGATDHGLEFGASVPLDAGWMLQADAAFAPDADFLARHAAELRAVRRFEHGVVATVGVRSARYRDQRADRALLSLERYAGAWRLAWTANLVRVDGHHAPGHEFGVDRYYGDRDSVGLRVSRGTESIALPAGDRSFAEVRSVALLGRHWLHPRWGVQWAAGHVDQSGLYDRGWLQLGLLHAW